MAEKETTENEEQKKDKKPFYDQNIEFEHECSKCKNKDKVVKRVYSVKKVIEPAVAAQVEIVTTCETVKTLNDFNDEKKGEDTKKKTPQNPDNEEEKGAIEKALGG